MTGMMPENPFQHDYSHVPASIVELCNLADQLDAMGIVCGFEPDHSVGMRGYLIVRIGRNTMHQMNIPAATALLDGALIGAREALRLYTLPKGN